MKFLKIAALCAAVSIFGAVAFAGAVDGPSSQADTVEDGKIDVYRLNFTGGEKATVRAKARGQNIELSVYDSHDVLVQKDSGHDVLVCSWLPKTTEEFKIKIVNNEKHSVDYKLETN